MREATVRGGVRAAGGSLDSVSIANDCDTTGADPTSAPTGSEDASARGGEARSARGGGGGDNAASGIAEPLDKSTAPSAERSSEAGSARGVDGMANGDAHIDEAADEADDDK
jgi:hypothetical protein